MFVRPDKASVTACGTARLPDRGIDAGALGGLLSADWCSAERSLFPHAAGLHDLPVAPWIPICCSGFVALTQLMSRVPEHHTETTAALNKLAANDRSTRLRPSWRPGL